MVSRRKPVPSLDKAPSLAAWHFKGKGPPAPLFLGKPASVNKSPQFAPTNPACSLGGCEPFFTQSCTQLCLRETDLAGRP